MKPTMGELFAGIGGFSLGFQRVGFEVKWQVEIEPYCQKVLAKNFPEAERFSDVREVGKHNLKPIDVICGGFPCQDISTAGHRRGIAEGTRSGLWADFARIISELRPKYVVVENVAALLERGMGRVLGDLAEIGYNAEWQVISAANLGAPHLRERVWICAYPSSERLEEDAIKAHIFMEAAHRRNNGHALTVGCEGVVQSFPTVGSLVSNPRALGSVHRVPGSVDRLKALGNAVVPQIPEWIAKRILEAGL